MKRINAKQMQAIGWAADRIAAEYLAATPSTAEEQAFRAFVASYIGDINEKLQQYLGVILQVRIDGRRAFDISLGDKGEATVYMSGTQTEAGVADFADAVSEFIRQFIKFRQAGHA